MSIPLTEISKTPGLRVLKTEAIADLDFAPQGDQPTQNWKSLSLVERSNILREALSYLDENTTDEEFDLVAESEEKFKEKLVGCGYVSRKYDQAAEIILSEAETLKAQAKALEERAKVFSNRAYNLRNFMTSAMLEHNVKKLETPMLTLSVRKKPPRVIQAHQVTNLDVMEQQRPEFVRVKKEANKKKILEALKSGEHLAHYGFELSDPEYYVVIK